MSEPVLHHGDCMDFLKTIEPESIDSLVTDPPYGIASETKVQKRRSSLETFNLEWDKELPTEWLRHAAIGLKKGAAGVIFTDAAMVTHMRKECRKVGLRPMQHFYWIKKNPPPNPRKNFRSAVEVAVFVRKAGPILAWNGGGHTTNTFICPIESKSTHPTQKPVVLMKHLVNLITPKAGGIVLDPFMGSGSTGVAALKLGHGFIGCEREEEYYTDTIKRIHEVFNDGQMKMEI